MGDKGTADVGLEPAVEAAAAFVPSISAINAVEDVFLTCCCCCCWIESFDSSAAPSLLTAGTALIARRLSAVISGLLSEGSADGESDARSSNGGGRLGLPSFSSSLSLSLARCSSTAAVAVAAEDCGCLLLAEERTALKMSSKSSSCGASLASAMTAGGRCGEAASFLPPPPPGTVDLRRKLSIARAAAATLSTCEHDWEWRWKRREEKAWLVQSQSAVARRVKRASCHNSPR